MKIEEKDQAGYRINDNDHFVNTLENVPCEDDSQSASTDTTLGVNRTVLSRSCALPNGATMSFEISVMNENGDFQNGNETLPVEKGDVKFSLLISHWQFTTLGETLDVDVIIKHPTKTETNMITERRNTISGGKQVLYSAVISNDGYEQHLEDNNPVAIQNGFRISFPKFDSFGSYDPIIRGYNSESSTNESDSSTLTYIIVGITGGVFASVASILIYNRCKKKHTYSRELYY
jgi:hypothetical protein